MTQHDLARAADVPQPSIARIERGTVIPRTATLITLLRVTGHRLAVEPTAASADREAIRKRLAMSVPRRTRETLGKPDKNPRTGPVHILRRLRRFGVPFVLVGGLAEVAHGSPARIGRIVEVCVGSTDVARERLRLALDDLGEEGEAGRLRVEAETQGGDAYEVLVRNAVPMPVASGIVVRVAALEDLIRIRRAGRAPEDGEAEAMLGAIVEETRARPRALTRHRP